MKYYINRKYIQIWYEKDFVILINHYWKGLDFFQRYGFKSLYCKVTYEQLEKLLCLENSSEDEINLLIEKISVPLYKKLIKYGFLQNGKEPLCKPVDYCVGGDNLAPYLKMQYGIEQISSPTKVQFLLTCRCFGNCSFCITNSTQFTTISELSDQEWVEITKRFAKELNPCQIDLIGGEPLIRFTAVKRICDVACLNKIMIRLITNGVLLADEIICKELAQILRGNRHYIQISVDGNETVHNLIRPGARYEDVLRAAKNLCDSKLYWGINLTVNKKNVDLLEEIVKEFAVYHPIHFEVGPLQTSIKDYALCKELVLTEEQEKNLRQKIEYLRLKYPNIDFVYNKRIPIYETSAKPQGAISSKQDSCSAFSKLMSILPDGRLIPCMRGCVHPEFYGESVIECVSLVELWRNSILKNKFRNIPLRGKCVKCIYNSQCNQGCPLETYVATGILGGLNPECQLQNQISEEIYYDSAR